MVCMEEGSETTHNSVSLLVAAQLWWPTCHKTCPMSSEALTQLENQENAAAQV